MLVSLTVYLLGAQLRQLLQSHLSKTSPNGIVVHPCQASSDNADSQTVVKMLQVAAAATSVESISDALLLVILHFFITLLAVGQARVSSNSDERRAQGLRRRSGDQEQGRASVGDRPLQVCYRSPPSVVDPLVTSCRWHRFAGEALVLSPVCGGISI